MTVMRSMMMTTNITTTPATTIFAQLMCMCWRTRSVLAIMALVIAKYSGWLWTDPAVGVVGSLVIGSWAYQLIRDAGSVLLDVSADKKLDGAIRTRLETRGDRVSDMHLWQLGPGHRAAVISLVSDDPLPPSDYKSRLTGLNGLSRVTIEVETCRHEQAQAC